MKVGKGEAETGKEPSETKVTQPRCQELCNIVVGHFFSVMSIGALSPSVFC